jgi:hypothetical protein
MRTGGNNICTSATLAHKYAQCLLQHQHSTQLGNQHSTPFQSSGARSTAEKHQKASTTTLNHEKTPAGATPDAAATLLLPVITLLLPVIMQRFVV